MTVPAVTGETPPARPGELTLKSAEFRRGREESWRELERLLGLAEKRGARALSAEELQRLPLLYRAALSSLSVARSIALDRNLLLYLENLALRAFLAVYGPRMRLRDGVAGFLRAGFPASVRAAAWHIAIAVAVLLAGVVAGFALTVSDESWFSAFVPAGLAGSRGPASTHASLADGEIFAPWPGATAAFLVLANFLFTHNTTIAILTFSLGIAAGVPTALLLVYQGLMLGAFLALHYNRGLTLEFLGWVAIHGVTEISAIILCAGAGFLVADKILFPGRYSRVESLTLYGQVAARIAAGAVLMLFVAAILEGGFRQLVQSTAFRLALGGLSGGLWLAYFSLAGRKDAA